MDELQISGRRFISSRRIAKDHGYTSDYIGQLIRGGKITGQKVGRAWYVDAASFDTYLSGEKGASAAAPVHTEVEEPVPAQVQEETPVEAEPGQTASEAIGEEVEEKNEIGKEEIVEKEKAGSPAVSDEQSVAIRITKFGSAAPTAGLRYAAEDEPLLPVIEPRSAATRLMPGAEEAKRLDTSKVIHHVEEKGGWKGPAVGLLVVGIIVFTASAFVSSSLIATMSVETGSPASVGYSFHW